MKTTQPPSLEPPGSEPEGFDNPNLAAAVVAERPVPPQAGPGRLHRLYLHVAWHTLAGMDLVPFERTSLAESQLLALCRRLGVHAVEVWVSPDRVHLLLRVAPGHSPGDLVRHLQAGSEQILSRAGIPVRWSRRYAAETVGPSEVRRVMRRIAFLAEHAAEAGRPSGGPQRQGRANVDAKQGVA